MPGSSQALQGAGTVSSVKASKGKVVSLPLQEQSQLEILKIEGAGKHKPTLNWGIISREAAQSQ